MSQPAEPGGAGTPNPPGTQGVSGEESRPKASRGRVSQAIIVAVDLGASGGRVTAGRVDGYELALRQVHRFGNELASEPSGRCATRTPDQPGCEK
jgi:hypothetical protein